MSRYSSSNPIVSFFKGLGIIGLVLGIIALFVFALVLPTVAVYGVWNWFVVAQFGMKPIGWLVSFLITVVLGLIFRGTTRVVKS